MVEQAEFKLGNWSGLITSRLIAGLANRRRHLGRNQSIQSLCEVDLIARVISGDGSRARSGAPR